MIARMRGFCGQYISFLRTGSRALLFVFFISLCQLFFATTLSCGIPLGVMCKRHYSGVLHHLAKGGVETRLQRTSGCLDLHLISLG